VFYVIGLIRLLCRRCCIEVVQRPGIWTIYVAVVAIKLLVTAV